MPYWIARNPLDEYFNPLEKNHATDVAIVGSGITGTLVAYELCKAGIRCTLVDKRTLSTGSSSASTALLQYEIDEPLHRLALKVGERNAVLAYQCCLKAIDDLEEVFRQAGLDAGFERVPSLFFASNKQGQILIEKEFEIRKKHRLPVSFLPADRVKKKYGIETLCALENHRSAQMDAYRASVRLLEYLQLKHGLTIYTHTQVTRCRKTPGGYELHTDRGHSIDCRYVVIAAGFEAGKFLPRKVMQLTSTYAILSEPVDSQLLWPGKSLLWETRDPYLYIRTAGNRILVGGEDEEFHDPVRRDDLLRSKTALLEKKFRRLFPHLPFKTDMAWCGTFSSTTDGLPYIGEWPGKKGMFFALGYGGNGITFTLKYK